MVGSAHRIFGLGTLDEQTQLHRSTKELFGRLFREHIRIYFGRVILALIMMAFVSGATALSAWLMQPIIDDVFTSANRDMLWPVGLAVLGTFAIKGAAQYGQAVVMAWIGQRIITDMQVRLYSHLMKMDIAFFHANSTGRLISRFTNDIGMMRNAVSNVMTGAGKDALTLIGLVAVMFIQQWQLGLIAFLVFPAAIIPIARLGKRMRKVSANTQVQMGEFMTLLEQTFQGIRHVKAYGMADYEKKRVSGLANGIFDLVYKASRTRAMSSPIMETLAGAAITLVIVYGGYQVIEGTTTSGQFFSFITAALLAYDPAKRLANLNTSLQEGLAAADRLFLLLDTEPTVVDQADAKELSIKGGTIEVADIHFSYETAEKATLQGITLKAEAGKTAALVGASGGGKSTVLNLIPRFYDVDQGAIFIDGQDTSKVTLESLRATMALVSQEITLFDDTVRANIAYGRKDASEEDIFEAAKNAAAHDFILELPNGYDTVVGELGVKLSGGQRQRLAIARAMLKNAPILLLDEATSALDTESERKVQAALNKLMENRTTLVIAHRLSTVVDADVIYVIDNGKVLEQGTHAELLAKQGAYANLYALQFAEEERLGQSVSA